MSSRAREHKQVIVAKCYELALVSLQGNGVSKEVDALAMSYLDKIIAAADIWTRNESGAVQRGANGDE